MNSGRIGVAAKPVWCATPIAPASLPAGAWLLGGRWSGASSANRRAPMRFGLSLLPVAGPSFGS